MGVAAAVAVVVPPVVEEMEEEVVRDGGDEEEEETVVVVAGSAVVPIMELNPWLWWVMAPSPQVKPLVRDGVVAAAFAAQL